MVRDEEKWPQWITGYRYFEKAALIITVLLFGLTLLWGGDAGYGYHDETGYFLRDHGIITQTTPLRWYISYALSKMFLYMVSIGIAWGISVYLSGYRPPGLWERLCHSALLKKYGTSIVIFSIQRSDEH